MEAERASGVVKKGFFVLFFVLFVFGKKK